MNRAPYRAGHVAVIGRPNVGKSTLINALVGAKVSIVSPRPQTTRHRLLGIATFPEGQLLLVDTPGIHSDKGKATASAMHRMMNRAARGALEGVDAALLVVRAGQWSEEDTLAYDALKNAGIPTVLVVNQVDRYPDKTVLLPYLQTASEGRDFASVHPLSALKRSGLPPLVKTVLGLLPEQPPLYAEDEITDKSQRFLAGELLREQLMRQLGEELPYAATVEIERFEEELVSQKKAARRKASPKHSSQNQSSQNQSSQNQSSTQQPPQATSGALPMYRIGAVIWVEREGQKAIVIGKGGSRLREIGTKARQQMERMFGCKVFLETWVRVREGWSDDEAALKAFGYSE
jgi:GTPase